MRDQARGITGLTLILVAAVLSQRGSAKTILAARGNISRSEIGDDALRPSSGSLLDFRLDAEVQLLNTPSRKPARTPQTREYCRQFCKADPESRDDKLPNVLLMGDSVSLWDMGYLKYVKSYLEGVAKVHIMGTFGDGYCGNSFGVMSCIDTFIGKGGWDVISFNWGLHDICPKLYGDVSTEAYIQNLREMHSLLQEGLTSNGVVIWQETTPIPPAAKCRKNSDILVLNDVARALWATYDPPVPQNKLYEVVVTECRRHSDSENYPADVPCPTLQFVDNVHFDVPGRELTGNSVAKSILNALKAQRKVSEDVTLRMWSRRRGSVGR